MIAEQALFVDIGSNSIRIMKAGLADGVFGFSDKRVYTTRLAEGLMDSGRLSEARMRQSIDVLRAARAEADAAGSPLYIYATSAVRDAVNRDEFLASAEKAAGCRVDVLCGEREARYAFLGACGGKGGLIDIGGGSTQLVADGFIKSYAFGCVRARDVCGDRDDFDELTDALMPKLSQSIPIPRLPETVWTGVGGTITTLAAVSLGLQSYDRGRVNGCRLTRAQAESTLRSLATLGDARRRHPLLTKRHDVILCGGAILLYLMDGLSISELRVSDADGMEGYAMHVLETP